jgi:hypothetical protein
MVSSSESTPPARVSPAGGAAVEEEVAAMTAEASVDLSALPDRLRRPPADPVTLSGEQANEAFVVLAGDPGSEYVVGMVGKFVAATRLVLTGEAERR